MKQLYYVIKTLLRGRGSNLIKIISLSLGLTMSILLFARIAFELSFDTCFKNNGDLYQIFSVWTTNGEKRDPSEQNMGPVAGTILQNFPKEVESATSICEYTVSGPLYYGSVRFDDKKVMADSLFFQTMGMEVLRGDPHELMNRDVIFLSDRLAKKIFGGDDPIGKTLMYNKELTLTVKGIYAALPENTTRPCDGVISMPTMWSRGWGNYSWNGGDSYPEYIRFKKGVDKESVMKRLDAMIAKYKPADMAKMQLDYTVFLKPICDVYREYKDVKRMVWIMSILAFSILFIAALNYVLISISSLSYRAKAIGVHKCSGASGGTVFGMFLMETGIIILLAIGVMLLLLFNFRDFAEDTTVAKLSSLFAAGRLWVPGLTVLFLFLIGGVLPGRLFSSIPVSQVFRRYSEGKKDWKRPLLFVQFAGVTFIAGLMCVVLAQYHYVTHKSMGYNADRVVVSSMSFNTSEKNKSDYILTYFKGLSYVEDVSSAWDYPAYGFSGEMVRNEAGKTLFSTRIEGEMENYPKMMGMTFKVGRMARDSSEVVVNETFAEWMHWGSRVVGRTLNLGRNYKVVGLLKDYRMNSFYYDQQPLVVYWVNYISGQLHIRLREPFAENLAKLNRESSDALPDKVIDFRSLEQIIHDNYNATRVFRNATIMSTVVMVFIMLMGLIGYTTDEVRRRSKEIAIRKVNGAEVSDVLHILSRDILYVALPAIVIGLVGAWYVNAAWMDSFSEKIPLSPVVYPLLGIVILLIIVGCVIWKSWRIANENPVNSIKSE
jgi:Predicted ABC-type transport system involved in lysophospholipase L1 biosynthesis, permease component